MSRIVDGEAIPDPSPVRRNQYQIAPDPTVALKAALQKAMRERKATAADLSRMLEIDHKEARRLLDLELAQLYLACWSPERGRAQRFRQQLDDYLTLTVRATVSRGAAE